VKFVSISETPGLQVKNRIDTVYHEMPKESGQKEMALQRRRVQLNRLNGRRQLIYKEGTVL
jgi:hypothetical protein